MQTRGAPSHSRYSQFRCEEATVTDVNRKTWTVQVETRHSAKTVPDIQCMVPYHHYSGGEGIHFLPEVGAKCYLAWPNDNTPPFILGFIGAAGTEESEDETPERSTPDGQGSMTDATFRSRRPQLNPGDIAFTTRDDNFIILHRGGVVQIGATSIAQRIYLPVLNYVKDFAENYDMHTFGGDVSWTVERQENDPGGNAPAQYVFHMNEYAQDAKASVRVRYFPLASPGGGDKTAWDISIAPQNIDKDTGTVTDEVYSLILTTEGKKTEVIGAAREVTVRGDDTLVVQGNREATISGSDSISASGNLTHTASGTATIGGAIVKQGSEGASQPGVLGTALQQWFATAVWTGGSGPYVVSPASLAMLGNILSRKVFLE